MFTMQADTETQLSTRQQRAFDVAQRAARQVLRRRFRVLRLVRTAYGKLFSHEDALTKVKDDLLTLLRLTRAWARREYRTIPWKSVMFATAALIYFVNPIDVIPDALFGIGFIDDIAVVSSVVHAIREDLEQFLSWEQENTPPA